MTKHEFLDLLQKIGINKKEFAELANIPYSTVNNWGVKRQGKVLGIPNWVEPFLLIYMKAKKFDLIQEHVCGVMRESV